MSEKEASRSASQRDYLTPGEVARALHVSPKTIIRWANENRIPCTTTLGGHRRFMRADVDRVIASLHRDLPGKTGAGSQAASRD